MTKNKDKTPKGKKLLFTLLAILVIVLIIAVYFIAKYLSGYDITGLPPHGRSDDTVELQVDPGTVKTKNRRSVRWITSLTRTANTSRL
jgi:flagellar basal body-associated protein FliL